MADDVRAKLIYDVSSARTAVRGLGQDLDRLERPLSLVVNVDDSQVEAANREIGALSRSLADLDIAIGVDDSQVEAAIDEAGALQRQLDDLDGTVNVDDSQVEAAISEVGGLQQQVDSIAGTVTIDVVTNDGGGGGGGSAGGIGGLTQGVGGLGQALRALGPAAGEAAASSGLAARSLAALGAAAGVAAGILAVLAAAIIGAGVAMKTTLAIGQGIVDLAIPAANLAESINAAGLIFEEQRDTILSFGDDAAKSFGLAEGAFLELANSVGASLRGLGVEIEAIDDLTVGVIKLATDLGSAYNVTTEQGVQAIQAALRGEFEQLESILIFVKQADIDAELARRGLEGLTGETEKSAKALVTLDLVQRKAALTANDFADTLGTSLPNQLKVARSNLENLGTDFSEAFREPALGIVEALNEDLIPSLQEAFTVAEPFVEALAEVGGDFIVDAIRAAGLALDFLTGALENFAKAAAVLDDVLLGPDFFPSIQEVQTVFDSLRIKAEEERKRRRAGNQEELEDLDALIGRLLEGEQFSLESQIRETDRLRDAFTEARASVDDLAKAIRDQFAKPTDFDLLIEQAEFEKVKAESLKEILELQKAGVTPTERIAGGLAELEKQRDAAAELFALQAELGKFDPAQFDATIASLAFGAEDLGRRLGIPKEQIDLFVASLEALGPGRDIEFRVALQQSVENLDQLQSTEEIIATLLANPEIETNLRVFGVPESLSNAEEVQTALDIIDGTIAEPEIVAQMEEFLEQADLTEYRVEALDELSANPTIGINDQATGRLNEIAGNIIALASGVATPTVTINDQASYALGLIEQSLARIRASSAIRIVAETILGRIPGAEMGAIVEKNSIIEVAEGDKRELILPLEQSWARQKALLDESGVLARMEEEFSAAEQARASALQRAMSWTSPSGPERGPSMADLERIAERMEEAARAAARESRPIEASIVVPAIRDEHEQARIIRRKLVRL